MFHIYHTLSRRRSCNGVEVAYATEKLVFSLSLKVLTHLTFAGTERFRTVGATTINVANVGSRSKK